MRSRPNRGVIRHAPDGVGRRGRGPRRLGSVKKVVSLRGVEREAEVLLPIEAGHAMRTVPGSRS